MFTFDLGDNAELRILEVHYAAELLAFVQANRWDLSQWINWVNNVHTERDARDFLQEGMDEYAREGLPTLGIWQNGVMAGGLGFFATNSHLRATEVGYWLGVNARGRGLMTRALRAALEYIFDTLNFNRVTLSAEVNNTRSRAVADRVGFTFEGIRRDGWKNGERFVDLAVYSMLARDWKNRKEENSG